MQIARTYRSPHIIDQHQLGMGTHIGRIVGSDATEFVGWQRLNAEYARQFGIETPKLFKSIDVRRG